MRKASNSSCIDTVYHIKTEGIVECKADPRGPACGLCKASGPPGAAAYSDGSMEKFHHSTLLDKVGTTKELVQFA